MILDLFAGPGGWDEGLRLLGHPGLVLGIEHDREACATRAAAGHLTIRADVSQYPAERFAGRVEGIIASPPCQAFSAAGKRGGARDADALRAHLLKCASTWTDPEPPQGGWVDQRAALVLEPLRWAHAVQPEWLALEQVPLVAKLWQTMAVAFEALGYRTKVEIVQAADYGVPQTRRRAVCLAHRSSWPKLPMPSHSQHGTPSRPKWISMAAALGWGPARVGFARRDDLGTSPDGYRERDLRDTDEPAFTVTEKARSWTLRTGTNTMKHSRDPEDIVPYERSVDEPSPVITSQSGAWKVGPEDSHVDPPMRWKFRGSAMPNAAVRDPETEPAPTVLSSWDNGDARFESDEQRVLINTGRDWKPGGTRDDAQILDVTDAPAPALTGKSGGQWWIERPATTIQGDPRVFHPGGHIAHDGRDNSKMKGRSEDAVRITVQDALVLQSFEPDYPVQGTKSKQFEQVGNAVPPLLAAHLLGALTGIGGPR